MWGTRRRVNKRIAGLQSAVSGIAISGIIEMEHIPTSNEADMNS
jgi:hypothetical protein